MITIINHVVDLFLYSFNNFNDTRSTRNKYRFLVEDLKEVRLDFYDGE